MKRKQHDQQSKNILSVIKFVSTTSETSSESYMHFIRPTLARLDLARANSITSYNTV